MTSECNRNLQVSSIAMQCLSASDFSRSYRHKSCSHCMTRLSSLPCITHSVSALMTQWLKQWTALRYVKPYVTWHVHFIYSTVVAISAFYSWVQPFCSPSVKHTIYHRQSSLSCCRRNDPAGMHCLTMSFQRHRSGVILKLSFSSHSSVVRFNCFNNKHIYSRVTDFYSFHNWADVA